MREKRERKEERKWEDRESAHEREREKRERGVASKSKEEEGMTLKVSDAICGKRICEKCFSGSERERADGARSAITQRTLRRTCSHIPPCTTSASHPRRCTSRSPTCSSLCTCRRLPLRPHITRCLCCSIWVIVHALHTWNDRHEDDHHDPPFPTPAHHLPNRTTRASKAHRAASPPNAKDPNEGAHHNIHEHQLLIRTTRNSTMNS